MEIKNELKLLDNDAIGKNISVYRKLRGIKATEVAHKLGLKEAAYTRLERGEGAITIDRLRLIGEVLRLNPLRLATVQPDNIINNGNNSAEAIVLSEANKSQNVNESHIQLALKLIESVTKLNEKLIMILDKKIV